MATRPQKQDEFDPTDIDGDVDPKHDAFVRAKVLKGLEQSRDRASMIPIDQIWRDLIVER